MQNVVPLHTTPPLFSEPAGRPGDWWEPVSAPAEVAGTLRVEARQHRLPIDLLAALVIEHALVTRDIEVAGIDRSRARAALGEMAATQPSIGPGRIHVGYVRTLRSGERDYDCETEEQLARRDLVLPLRLHDATCTLDLREVCEAAALDEAIAWETAAASSGQLMREWALGVLLTAFAS
jgi:hypothetical protein